MRYIRQQKLTLAIVTGAGIANLLWTLTMPQTGQRGLMATRPSGFMSE